MYIQTEYAIGIRHIFKLHGRFHTFWILVVLFFHWADSEKLMCRSSNRTKKIAYEPNDCDWKLVWTVLVGHGGSTKLQTTQPNLSCVDWYWYKCERIVWYFQKRYAPPNSCKQPPGSILMVCDHDSNMIHPVRRKKKGPDWELNPGPLPNFISMLEYPKEESYC